MASAARRVGSFKAVNKSCMAHAYASTRICALIHIKHAHRPATSAQK
jgi:hypothetical protein